MKKLNIKLVIIGLAALGLVGASVGTALAGSGTNKGHGNIGASQGPEEKGRGKIDQIKDLLKGKHQVMGKVKAVEGNVITLENEKTVTVDKDTRFLAPPDKEASLADVKVGSNIVAQLEKKGDTVVARRVLIMPERPPVVAHVGKVTAFTAGASITIEDKKGETSRFAIDADTKIVLPEGVAGISIGDIVTIAVKPGSEPPLARVITVHRERAFETLTGTITAIGADTITLKLDDGKEVVVKFNGDTIF
ncbi:MAG: hypothetical protein HYX95_01230, partial [Chloroflexi bacterium]|nr:hypothetical protein [Chloroflexota bacterium]